MAVNETPQKLDSDEKYESQELNIGFLPDLCSATAVLSLVLIGELLSLALILADDGFGQFSWQNFGIYSFLIQWVLLSSAASLCLLRVWLNTLSPSKTLSFSYLIVLLFTFSYSVIGQLITTNWVRVDWMGVLTNLIIAAIFAGVMLRYLYLQQLLKRREQTELSAQLQALQSRIRPHFLFNSLNSIASLIVVKPELAEKMVVDLATLFRASLKLPQLIPIEDELDLCRHFCDIEQIRLGKRLTITWRIGKIPERTPILNLILQPLIENAINHGIQAIPEGGEIVVEINASEKELLIKVYNPCLMGGENSTRASANLDRKESGNGIALLNIRRRLDAVYGRSASLRVVKGEADFTVVVRYPLAKG